MAIKFCNVHICEIRSCCSFVKVVIMTIIVRDDNRCKYDAHTDKRAVFSLIVTKLYFIFACPKINLLRQSMNI
jgi:hypothetical protein